MGLEESMSALLRRREDQGRLRALTATGAGRRSVDFSSNGYLSLSSDAETRRAFLAMLNGEEFSLGSGGSRLLDGNSAAAEALERRIAAFHGAPAGLLFNSGFDANTGLFASGPQEGDVLVYDELVHASAHDGMKLSRASRRIPFPHNSADGLDDVLSRLHGEDAGVRSAQRNVFVAVEAVYSMDGDMAPLREVVECVERRLPLGNGYVIVDEAHSTGILGDRGRGLVCELGLEKRIWARVHTFGKAMGCSGAIVLCSHTMREYLINYARSFIYTTAMGFPALASIRVAYDFLASDRAVGSLRRLRKLVRAAHRTLVDLVSRLRPPSYLLRIAQKLPESPIVPIFTSKARSLAQHCQQRGFLIRPIVAPTVPRGTDRVRLCLHAGNSLEEVQGLCEVLEAWLNKSRL